LAVCVDELAAVWLVSETDVPADETEELIALELAVADPLEVEAVGPWAETYATDRTAAATIDKDAPMASKLVERVPRRT
jgi:hypothetical protein